jgi:hypothetical protein
MAEPFARRFVAGIDANRTVKDELSKAIAQQRARRRISVTDLVNPRQAFFRWTHPEIQPSPEKLQAMLSGTGFHELFGKAVSTEEFVEQFVEMDRIVGKIDIYEEVPAELKTTGFIPDDILAARPAYIDQLGMYCTMVGKAKGRLLLYRRAQYGREPMLKAFEVAFTDLDAVAREMRRRRDLLEAALAQEDPSGLPRCEWFNLNCDYEGICGCETAEPMGRVVPRDSIEIEELAPLAAQLSEQLRETPEPRTPFTLNDLVFPRKAAYQRQATDEEESAEDAALEARLAQLEREGFKGALYKAIRFGVPGSFARIPLRLRDLQGTLQTYRGTPTLLRATKIRQMVERDRLAEIFSHYFDRLAFECALSRQRKGRVILYYEALAGEKFMVYDIWFRNLDQILAEADRRLTLLESGAPPSELPPCPAWMAKFCRFAPGCGCGEA